MRANTIRSPSNGKDNMTEKRSQASLDFIGTSELIRMSASMPAVMPNFAIAGWYKALKGRA